MTNRHDDSGRMAKIRVIGMTVAAALLAGCAESRQIWPPFCETQTLTGPGRLASHHFVVRDPWPLTTGTYDYLDYLGLDAQGRARIRATSGDVEALGFIGGIGAGTVNMDAPRVAPGTGPEPVHDRICLEVLAATPDGAGGHVLSYRLTRRDADARCLPCPDA